MWLIKMSQTNSETIRNNKLLKKIILFVFFMVGLSYASVPLYDLFCRVTGYGGTTQKASLAPGSQGNYRNIQIRFDANVNNNLNWEFLAPKDEILVQPGVEKIIYYTAKNLSDKTWQKSSLEIQLNNKSFFTKILVIF